MPDVRAVIELRQGAQQADAPDRSPANHLDEPVGRIGVRRNQHRSPRVLAVVEAEEQAAPLVPVGVVIAAQRKGAPAQLHQPQENSQQVAELAERLEAAIRERGHIRRKAEAQQIERIELAGGVFQPEQVAGASATFEKRLQGGVGPVLSEIAQKGIARAQRQKPQLHSVGD